MTTKPTINQTVLDAVANLQPHEFVHPAVMAHWARICESPPPTTATATAAAAANSNTLLLEGYVGDEINLRMVQAVLRAVGPQGDISVDINSPGGLIHEGVSIYNSLARHEGRVTVNVIGTAASAAQMITMAGDEILMGKGATQFIHNIWALVMGNAHTMREVASDLDTLDDGMFSIICGQCNQPLSQVSAWARNDTLFSAQEAIDNGLAHGYIKEHKDTAERSASAMAHDNSLTQAKDILAETNAWHAHLRQLTGKEATDG